MLYAGMDIHKKFSGYSMTKEGEIVKKGKVKTNEKERRDISWLRKLSSLFRLWL